MVDQRRTADTVSEDRLQSAKNGDVEAISYLYQYFHKCVFWYVYNKIRDYHTAEDLTSAVFSKMVENICKIRASNEAGFRSWLLEVARTTIAQHYRDCKRLECISLENTLELPCVTEKRGAVTEAFNALTEEQKQAIDGTVVLNYSAEVVGKMMGKKANTVRGLRFRGLNAMKRILVAATLIILSFLGITIKLIHDASPRSPLYSIKLLGGRIAPGQGKNPHIKLVPTSTVMPTIQPVPSPVATPTVTTTPIATITSVIQPSPTSAHSCHDYESIACIHGMCL